MRRYEGLPGAKGQALGQAVLMETKEYTVLLRSISDAEEEVERFKKVQAE